MTAVQESDDRGYEIWDEIEEEDQHLKQTETGYKIGVKTEKSSQRFAQSASFWRFSLRYGFIGFSDLTNQILNMLRPKLAPYLYFRENDRIFEIWLIEMQISCSYVVFASKNCL